MDTQTLQNQNDQGSEKVVSLDDYIVELQRSESAKEKLDQLYVYDDVQDIVAYVSQLTGAAKNQKLGVNPKLRLKRLYDMTKRLFHDLKDIFIKPIIFNDVVPDNKKNDALIILALSGRTKEQCQEIANNPEKLRLSLYILTNACEAAAYGSDANGDISVEKAEEYLLNKFSRMRKMERVGGIYESIVNGFDETSGISGDIG